MKKKTSLLLLIAAVSLGSCKKSGCWKCATRQVNNKAVLFSGAAARFTECGKTEAEIRQLEKERTGSQTYTNSNGVSTTSSAITTCK